MLYLFFTILLITFAILYFYYSDTPPHKDVKPSSTEKMQESKTEDHASNLKSKTPALYRTAQPFNESENITTESFTVFKGAKILFVEDNVINQKILLSTLKKSGIDICVANNGKEALNKLFERKQIFDLILMDISMPVMDGYTATEMIRKDHTFDAIPIVTFTAFTRGGEIKKMFDLGANGHITKPLNIAQLYTVFNTYLPGINREVTLRESLNINGLDVRHGIVMEKGDEAAYRNTLFDFLIQYKGMITMMPYWIDHHQSERIMSTCSKMGKRLKHIGAYELADIVFRMKKIYVYNTEHRIEEFRDVFPQKLKTLTESIERYLREG